MECTHCFPSFGRLECVGGVFGPKMAVFGPKLQFLELRSAICESCSRPPPLSFLLKLCVIVLHTHRYHAPKFQPNPKNHDGVLIFPHFARAACLLAACLLLACLLLAAKPGRSTLDSKKGYKTKTGSTTSVKIGHIFGHMAQNAIPRAPSPPATPHFLWFPPLRIAQTDA